MSLPPSTLSSGKQGEVTVPSFVGWLDYSEAERRQVQEMLQLFTEKGTVDDLGVGTVRDAISNRLFPGTSVGPTDLDG